MHTVFELTRYHHSSLQPEMAADLGLVQIQFDRWNSALKSGPWQAFETFSVCYPAQLVCNSENWKIKIVA
jgi:hypothetical protein